MDYNSINKSLKSSFPTPLRKIRSSKTFLHVSNNVENSFTFTQSSDHHGSSKLLKEFMGELDGTYPQDLIEICSKITLFY